MGLPESFCWTRYGTEAGETFDAILERKERERRGNGGLFLWGIGSALGPSIHALVESTARPQVVFSPIRSAPREQDVSPQRVVRWAAGETLSGERYPLPDASVVTSRFAPTRSHYALVCFSPQPLRIASSPEELAFRSLRNLISGRPLGASQVTAVVKRNERPSERGPVYPATIVAELRAPFFVRLTEAVEAASPGLRC